MPHIKKSSRMGDWDEFSINQANLLITLILSFVPLSIGINLIGKSLPNDITRGFLVSLHRLSYALQHRLHPFSPALCPERWVLLRLPP